MLGLAVMGAVLYTLFQKSAPAFGLFVSMGTAVLVLWKISTAAQTVLSGLTKLEQRAGGDAFSCLLRCTGVILLAGFPLHSRWTSEEYLRFLRQNGWTVRKSAVLKASFPLTYAECVKMEV